MLQQVHTPCPHNTRNDVQEPIPINKPTNKPNSGLPLLVTHGDHLQQEAIAFVP